MQVAILLFDGITALDAVGPYEVLWRVPGAEVVFVAEQAGPKVTDNRLLGLVAGRSLHEVTQPEVLVVPGGLGTRSLVHHEPLLDWIRRVHQATRWTTSVCTGALLLGAAGILDGLEATTNWLSLERLPSFGATPVQRRVVEQGKVITSAGVTAGIDMALTLAARIAGDDVAQAIQLSMEYDPQPPFNTGSPLVAPRALVERVRARAQAAEAQVEQRGDMAHAHHQPASCSQP